MVRKYRICGLRAECDFSFHTMTARAEKYVELLRKNNLALSVDEDGLCGNFILTDFGLSLNTFSIFV